MPRKRFRPEQIFVILRQIEAAVGQDAPVALACKAANISERTYYRWRKDYGGMGVDQAKRLKLLRDENTWLKKLVAYLSLEKQVLKDIAQGNL